MSNAQVNQMYIGLSLMGLAVLFAIPLIYMDQLPDRIPIHFNGSGAPDGFGNKSMIWILPIVGGVLFIVITSLGHYLPRLPHDPKKSTKEVFDQIMTWSIHLMGILNVIISWTFTYILYRSVQVALEKAEGLGGGFLPVFLGLIFTPMIYICWKMYVGSK